MSGHTAGPWHVQNTPGYEFICPELLEALRDLLGERGDLDAQQQCIRCGRDYEGADDLPPGSPCPSDDCPAFIARAAIAKAEGR